MADQVDRLTRIANQMLGDLEQATNEQQKLQIIFDAYEQVGVMAIEAAEAERSGVPYEEYAARPIAGDAAKIYSR